MKKRLCPECQSEFAPDDEKSLLGQEAKVARRRIFGAPIVWPDEVGGVVLSGTLEIDGEADEEFPNTGLTAHRASDIESKAIKIPAADDPLMVAARKAFPKSAPSYLAMIVHRYRLMYQGIPEADAIRVILRGYSSPQHAMQSRQLKRRPLKGETK